MNTQENNNIILMSDSYKIGHWLQYKKGTEYIISYFESRGGLHGFTVFYLLQYYLKKYLSGVVVTKEMIDEAEILLGEHFGLEQKVFNREGWEYILNEHGGKLPIRIKAVKEGTVVPSNNVLFTIENTDKKCFWLTNYIETLIMKLWSPCTVAANSFASKKLIKKYFDKTSDETNILFQLHCFGYRGVSSEETARINGSAHLLSFMGTDTLGAIVLTKDYYSSGVSGYSVIASEHSTITPFGLEAEEEKEAVLNLLNNFPKGILSCVGDSKDIYRFTKLLYTDDEVRNKIVNRDGRFVVRPDSGVPTEVVPKLLTMLDEGFGTTINSKGYKVLPPYIRIIQGDGIDYDMIGKILDIVTDMGYSAENVIFGSGGALLQKFDRDTQKFAIKCNKAIINGEEVNVQKDPITAPGKKSKPGDLKLIKVNGEFQTASSIDYSKDEFDALEDHLELVFENGDIKREQTFNEIREILNNYL